MAAAPGAPLAERGAARLPEERRAGPPPRGRPLDLHGVRRLALGHDVARAEPSECDGGFFGVSSLSGSRRQLTRGHSQISIFVVVELQRQNVR